MRCQWPSAVVDRMASFTASELRFCRATLGLEEGDAQSLEETASGFKAAAEAVHAARAAADAQKKEAEILAELGDGDGAQELALRSIDLLPDKGAWE